ncbi:hypothetical protein FACS1894170_06970 [Planctomycetales bacterium]|nr:hypothetical protein FACS1894170_06970 [Planctomycetales bacterium]
MSSFFLRPRCSKYLCVYKAPLDKGKNAKRTSRPVSTAGSGVEKAVDFIIDLETARFKALSTVDYNHNEDEIIGNAANYRQDTGETVNLLDEAESGYSIDELTNTPSRFYGGLKLTFWED